MAGHVSLVDANVCAHVLFFFLLTCRPGTRLAASLAAAGGDGGGSTSIKADVALVHLMQPTNLEKVASEARQLRLLLLTQMQNWMAAGRSGVVSGNRLLRSPCLYDLQYTSTSFVLLSLPFTE